MENIQNDKNLTTATCCEKEERVSAEDIKKVYMKLRDREENPKGDFDKQGRFYLDDQDLVNVRQPTRSWPFPQMVAGRTLKFVKALAEKYKCKNIKELEAVAFG